MRRLLRNDGWLNKKEKSQSQLVTDMLIYWHSNWIQIQKSLTFKTSHLTCQLPTQHSELLCYSCSHSIRTTTLPCNSGSDSQTQTAYEHWKKKAHNLQCFISFQTFSFPNNRHIFCISGAMREPYRTRMENVLMSLSSWSNRAMDWMIMLSTRLTLNLTLALE